MLLRVVNIFQLPTSTILSCETEDAIPDRISGRYELRDNGQLRQVLDIEGRVSVRQVGGQSTTQIDVFTREAVQLSPEEASSGLYSLAAAEA